MRCRFTVALDFELRDPGEPEDGAVYAVAAELLEHFSATLWDGKLHRPAGQTFYSGRRVAWRVVLGTPAPSEMTAVTVHGAPDLAPETRAALEHLVEKAQAALKIGKGPAA